MVKDSVETRNKKKVIIERCFTLFDKFSQIILVGFSNVGSSQMQQIRKLLAKKGGQLVIAKNTLLTKIINLRAEPLDPNQEDYELLKKFGAPKPELRALLPHLKEKVGLIFTDEPVFDLKGKIEESKLATEAKVGSISPIDFIIQPGPTGLDPSQINFFHALQISTKIEKAQIQITKEYKVCTAGKKVGNSEATLLKKLGHKPFFYGMVVLGAYDSGSILSKDVVGMNPEELVEKFAQNVRNIIGLSVEIGHPTSATIPFIIANSFKNIAALSIESGFKIKELDNMGSSSAPAKPAAKKEDKQEKPAPAKVEEKKKEPEPEEEEEMSLSLFD